MGFNVSSANISNLKNEGLTLYVGGSVASEGDRIQKLSTVKVVADDGYEITEARFKYNDNNFNTKYFNLKISEDKKSAESKLDVDFSYPNWQFSTKEVPIEPPEPDPVLKFSDDNLVDNIAIFKNDEPVESGTLVFNGDVLKIEPNSGFKIVSYSLKWRDDDFNDYNKQFSISEDGKSGVLDVDDFPETDGGYSFNQEYEVEQEQVTSGSIGVFLIDEEKLTELNKERFSLMLGTDTVLDYNSFILSIFNFPLILDGDYLLEEENIKLGDKKTDVIAPRFKSELINYDLGKIVVPSKFKNSLDFEDTKTILVLPRVGEFELPPEYVIDREISVIYRVNLNTGEATINVKNDDNVNYNFESKLFQLGYSVPRDVSDSNKSVEEKNIDYGVLNEIKIPFIRVERYEPKNLDDKFNVTIDDSEKLSGKSGYYVFIETNVDFCDNNEESEILDTVLKQGILIND